MCYYFQTGLNIFYFFLNSITTNKEELLHRKYWCGKYAPRNSQTNKVYTVFTSQIHLLSSDRQLNKLFASVVYLRVDYFRLWHTCLWNIFCLCPHFSIALANMYVLNLMFPTALLLHAGLASDFLQLHESNFFLSLFLTEW